MWVAESFTLDHFTVWHSVSAESAGFCVSIYVCTSNQSHHEKIGFAINQILKKIHTGICNFELKTLRHDKVSYIYCIFYSEYHLKNSMHLKRLVYSSSIHSNILHFC